MKRKLELVLQSSAWPLFSSHNWFVLHKKECKAVNVLEGAAYLSGVSITPLSVVLKVTASPGSSCSPILLSALECALIDKQNYK